MRRVPFYALKLDSSLQSALICLWLIAVCHVKVHVDYAHVSRFRNSMSTDSLQPYILHLVITILLVVPVITGVVVSLIVRGSAKAKIVLSTIKIIVEILPTATNRFSEASGLIWVW